MDTRLYSASLPPEISWLNNSQIEDLLQISPSVLRRDKSTLRSLKLLKIPERAKGCGRDGIQLLMEFRQLIEERGREEAIKEIWRNYGPRKGQGKN